MIDRRELIKNFTVGFLPLLVFIIADAFYGLTIGLLAAIVFGVVETTIIYLKNRIIDKFILFDTGLIILLGLISIILQNDIFFKIKPALIEGILLILLGLTAFSDNLILVKMSGRYLKGIQLSGEQQLAMKQMTRRLFFVFLVHTLLIVYSAFYMSKEAWAFISGGLFYVLIGIMMGFEFLRSLWQRHRVQKKYAGEEWFDIVTPDGKITGKAPRSAVHGQPKLLHPVVHTHIINSKGEIFLQKRSADKDIQPDKWDAAIGGHIRSGESVDHALRREAEEELGLSYGEFVPLFRYVMKNELESELVHGFLLREEGPFFPDPHEISEARFWNREDIRKNLGKNIFTPNFEKEFALLEKIVFREDIHL
ncbi:MAG: NUDIX domain-containing protein [Calditrichaeota bacterium]|nr:NUDIX domain-containing protein [Calditrichota bacterium]RQV92526.1 MAG: NUDIX domain-containing protein [bacterium]